MLGLWNAFFNAGNRHDGYSCLHVTAFRYAIKEIVYVTALAES